MIDAVAHAVSGTDEEEGVIQIWIDVGAAYLVIDSYTENVFITVLYH